LSFESRFSYPYNKHTSVVHGALFVKCTKIGVHPTKKRTTIYYRYVITGTLLLFRYFFSRYLHITQCVIVLRVHGTVFFYRGRFVVAPDPPRLSAVYSQYSHTYLAVLVYLCIRQSLRLGRALLLAAWEMMKTKTVTFTYLFTIFFYTIISSLYII